MKKIRGFTLIEVLIATSLLALGLALAFATMRSATRATERADAIAGASEQARAVQGLLRRQIGGALPIAFELDMENGTAHFLRASASKLEFVAVMPGYLSRGGPYLQTLEFVPGEHGLKLVFQFHMLTPDGPAEAEREPVVLLEGIAEGSFAVRDIDEQSKPGKWQPLWEASTQLPPLVRVDLRFRDARRRWPALVIAPRLGVPFGGAVPILATGDAAPGDRQ